jgi:hypothetical protein
MTAVADGPVSAGASATAVSLCDLATLGGVALLTWFEVDPSGHPGILPTAAVIIGGSSIRKAAIDDVAISRRSAPSFGSHDGHAASSWRTLRARSRSMSRESHWRPQESWVR